MASHLRVETSSSASSERDYRSCQNNPPLSISSFASESDQTSSFEESSDDDEDMDTAKTYRSEQERQPLGWRSEKSEDEEELVGSGVETGGRRRERQSPKTKPYKIHWVMRSQASDSNVGVLQSFLTALQKSRNTAD